MGSEIRRDQDDVPATLGDTPARTFRGLRNLADSTTPWLIDVGSWIFGGLIAINLVVISALITVGPIDAAIRMATAALAAAVPVNLAGIILLRFIRDVKELGLEDLTLQAFQQAGFPDIHTHFPSPSEQTSRRSRQARMVLAYALGVAALSAVLTLIGLGAALWHMGRWIAYVLLGATVSSAVLVAVAVIHSWAPPSSAGQSQHG